MTDLLTTVGDLTITDRFVADPVTDRIAGVSVIGRRPDRAVHAGREPDQMAPRHTSWFFETFLLIPHLAEYQPFHPDYGYLFNSYYEGVGSRYPRNGRGFLSRPGIKEIGDYRSHVDEAMTTLLDRPAGESVAGLVELGIQHEQQHQELLLMDIKHVLSLNPLHPAYDAVRMPKPSTRALRPGSTTRPAPTKSVMRAWASVSTTSCLVTTPTSTGSPSPTGR